MILFTVRPVSSSSAIITCPPHLTLQVADVLRKCGYSCESSGADVIVIFPNNKPIHHIRALRGLSNLDDTSYLFAGTLITFPKVLAEKADDGEREIDAATAATAATAVA